MSHRPSTKTRAARGAPVLPQGRDRVDGEQPRVEAGAVREPAPGHSPDQGEGREEDRPPAPRLAPPGRLEVLEGRSFRSKSQDGGESPRDEERAERGPHVDMAYRPERHGVAASASPNSRRLPTP